MLCPTFVLVAKMQIFFSFLGMSSRNLVQILSFSRHMTKNCWRILYFLLIEETLTLGLIINKKIICSEISLWALDMQIAICNCCDKWYLVSALYKCQQLAAHICFCHLQSWLAPTCFENMSLFEDYSGKTYNLLASITQIWVCQILCDLVVCAWLVKA